MHIFCNVHELLERAVTYSKKLDISHADAEINIYRLPPSFTQKGIIEHPRVFKGHTYINIYIRLDNERYVTLAHEMIHAKQILEGREIDENEAYALERTLDNDR
tara:strand:+ start:308 stop:619 length:312 start_codon:yes stop_codon:yes gene_type:complete